MSQAKGRTLRHFATMPPREKTKRKPPEREVAVFVTSRPHAPTEIRTRGEERQEKKNPGYGKQLSINVGKGKRKGNARECLLKKKDRIFMRRAGTEFN